jgi:glycosyltransferase involved in cell wall biosynthesis
MIGRMIYWKGLPYGIRAFAEFKKCFPAARLSICGDGPEWKQLENLCAELGISDSVDFLYNYTHQQAIDLYPQHSVYLSPIVHYNGIAVLEAMDAGVPVVELDTEDANGPVNDEVGIRVQKTNPEQAVRDLAAALTRLAEDPALARKMGEAGHRRVCERFDPKQRVSVIDSVYEDLRAANRGS